MLFDMGNKSTGSDTHSRCSSMLVVILLPRRVDVDDPLLFLGFRNAKDTVPSGRDRVRLDARDSLGMRGLESMASARCIERHAVYGRCNMHCIR